MIRIIIGQYGLYAQTNPKHHASVAVQQSIRTVNGFSSLQTGHYEADVCIVISNLSFFYIILPSASQKARRQTPSASIVLRSFSHA